MDCLGNADRIRGKNRMTSLVECPHCSTRVLPMAGRICPACRKNVDNQPDPIPSPERVVKELYGAAAEQIGNGVAPSGVANYLTERGLNSEAAATVVNDLQQAKAHAKRAAGQRNMLIGAISCIVGVTVTALTMQAASGAAGGRYVIAWGAIVYGGLQFVRGVIQSTDASR
jgi:hypothetical protein